MTEHKFKVGDVVDVVCSAVRGQTLPKRQAIMGFEDGHDGPGVCAVLENGDVWHVSRLALSEPLPSPSQPASQWVEVDRNPDATLWRNPANGCNYIQLAGEAGPEDDDPVEYEANRFELGERMWRYSYDSGATWESVFGFIPRDSAEAPKDSDAAHQGPGTESFPSGRGARVQHQCGVAPSRGDSGRSWDSDKYSGVVSWQPLDQRIAAARELLDRKLPEHPHEGRSDRVYGGRRW